MNNLAITGIGGMTSAYIGNRMISGAKGLAMNPSTSKLLGNRATSGINSFSKMFDKVSKYDPIEALSTKVAKASGSAALGTAFGAGLSGTVSTIGEEA